MAEQNAEPVPYHRWARRPQGLKRTATGSARTDPPWHAITTGSSAVVHRTVCGKGLRGSVETAGGLPSDGPACPACMNATGERRPAAMRG